MMDSLRHLIGRKVLVKPLGRLLATDWKWTLADCHPAIILDVAEYECGCVWFRVDCPPIMATNQKECWISQDSIIAD